MDENTIGRRPERRWVMPSAANGAARQRRHPGGRRYRTKVTLSDDEHAAGLARAAQAG